MMNATGMVLDGILVEAQRRETHPMLPTSLIYVSRSLSHILVEVDALLHV